MLWLMRLPLVYLNHSKDFWDTVGSLDANINNQKLVANKQSYYKVG